jgi:hypothetical protein
MENTRHGCAGSCSFLRDRGKLLFQVFQEGGIVRKVPLKPLHAESSLSLPKVLTFRKLSTSELIRSLYPGESGALKVKEDGTII